MGTIYQFRPATYTHVLLFAGVRSYIRFTVIPFCKDWNEQD